MVASFPMISSPTSVTARSTPAHVGAIDLGIMG
jgi:hypothetical protein